MRRLFLEKISRFLGQMKNIINLKKNYMSNPSKVLTLANVISLLRAAAAIPIIYTLNYPEMRAISSGIVILLIIVMR